MNSDSNQEYIPSTIYVSLYLFLLIFFVLLNSSAKKNAETAKQAIESINKSFSTKTFFSHDSKIIEASVLSDNYEVLKKYFIDQIRKNINQNYAKLEPDKNNKTNFDKISVSSSLIFKDNSDQITEDYEKILAELASLISLNTQKNRLRVEITIGIKDNESNLDEQLAEKRILSLYKIMLKNRANQMNLLLGLDKSNQESVTLSFFLTN